MKKIILIILIIFMSIYSNSQNDSIMFGSVHASKCSEIVYSIYDLLIDGEFMCDFFSNNPIKSSIKDIHLINESIIENHSYFDFKKYNGIYEIEIYSLIVLNNKILTNLDAKNTLCKYREQDITEFYFTKRLRAIRKFGWKHGRKGALIINTK